MDYKVKIRNIGESCVLTKIPKDAQGFLATEISKNFSDSDIIFIAQNDSEMDVLQQQIRFFSPDSKILIFPAWDCLPFDRASPKPLILANRIKTLYRLATRRDGEKFFIITAINSLLQKTITPGQIKDLGLYLQIGSKASITQISEMLVAKGYERRACANNACEFAVRGGIVDVVMQQAADLTGYRIDFFGEEVESIKLFDPITQLTQEAVKSLEILPASEVLLSKKTVENFRHKYRLAFGAPRIPLSSGIESTRSGAERDDGGVYDQLYNAISDNRSYPGMEHWLPFFYEEDLVSFFSYLKNPVTFSGEEIFVSAKHREELISEYFQARSDDTTYNAISPNLLYFTADEFAKNLGKTIAIQFNKFDCPDQNQRVLDLEIKPIPDFALAGRTNQRDPIELMKEWGQTPKGSDPFNPTLAFLTESSRNRLNKLLPDYGLKCPTILLPLHFGFYTSDFILIGEQAIFGEKIIRKKSSKSASQRLIEEGLSIQPGELVVHRDHGIGRFEGIQTLSVCSTPPSSRNLLASLANASTSPLNMGDATPQQTHQTRIDMIKIAYGGNETLFVPVNDIDLITRYGADNPLIQLDRLGVAGWKNRREKVRKRIKVAAEELLKIAAARQLRKAEIFIPEQHFYDEFKNRFGYLETDDQLRAIEEVEEDLAKGSPMDRLICGDVGFGKTEVAMRAAALVSSYGITLP
ncbi:MAG: hypothetical protein FJX34_04330, partial [Alphaproteobacteria bacterium]|nr:hypothetical protein [Alphaproteobacteria bacterium]